MSMTKAARAQKEAKLAELVNQEAGYEALRSRIAEKEQELAEELAELAKIRREARQGICRLVRDLGLEPTEADGDENAFIVGHRVVVLSPPFGKAEEMPYTVSIYDAAAVL